MWYEYEYVNGMLVMFLFFIAHTCTDRIHAERLPIDIHTAIAFRLLFYMGN